MPKPQVERKRRQVHYAFARKGDSILLVQRGADAKRMAGMWELPELAADSDQAPLARFRHSITDTDYDVFIVAAPSMSTNSLDSARWFTRKQWEKLALTGLTRKILRKLAPATWPVPRQSK